MFQITKALIPLGMLLVIMIIVNNEWNYQTKTIRTQMPIPIMLEEKTNPTTEFSASNVSMQRHDISIAQTDIRKYDNLKTNPYTTLKKNKSDLAVGQDPTSVDARDKRPLEMASTTDGNQCTERVSRVIYIKTRKTGSSTMTNILYRYGPVSYKMIRSSFSFPSNR